MRYLQENGIETPRHGHGNGRWQSIDRLQAVRGEKTRRSIAWSIFQAPVISTKFSAFHLNYMMSGFCCYHHLGKIP
jgi:hypothetical protein